ncbi:30S ribosomal protein S19e [Candidatus Pacearchaeota archaeon]|nr:30S ribosomal protein S19e [Candidatus Pacearchaeota archaeon]|tara:strand:- start:8599 stop:8997 length:399 start_codon:yes stop_codon:yes gene_type:complete
MTIYEISHREFNNKLAEQLKQIPEFKAPEWSFYVKTSVARERPTQEPDFWNKRAASILRQIYINRLVGVNSLKTRYGGKKNRGAAPPKFKRGSGKIIRVILQQAEAAGLVEKADKKGRKLTEKGRQLLEEIK